MSPAPPAPRQPTGSAGGAGGGSSRSAFFVGWRRVPRPLALFLLLVVAVAAGLGLGAGAAWVLAQADPGDGRYAPELGYQELTGVLQVEPYPVLRLPPDAGHPKGHALMLVAAGKHGVVEEAADLAGAVVDVGGILIVRGDAEILQVGEPVGLRAAEAGRAREVAASFTPAAPETVGRYRLRGEIVDSKCYLGAMHPGAGKTHMGCANLCLLGGIPPVFVTAAGSAGGPRALLLLADPDGRALPLAALRDYTSLAVELEGEVERRDDLLVFKVRPESLTVL